MSLTIVGTRLFLCLSVRDLIGNSLLWVRTARLGGGRVVGAGHGGGDFSTIVSRIEWGFAGTGLIRWLSPGLLTWPHIQRRMVRGWSWRPSFVPSPVGEAGCCWGWRTKQGKRMSVSAGWMSCRCWRVHMLVHPRIWGSATCTVPDISSRTGKYGWGRKMHGNSVCAFTKTGNSDDWTNFGDRWRSGIEHSHLFLYNSIAFILNEIWKVMK